MTNNQTNWQELCAQLHKALEAHSTTWDDDVLLDRVWVALRAAESRHKRKLSTQVKPEPEQLPQGYIDPEHKDQERELLEVFYRACQSEGGTADEIHLRGIKAVLANAPLTQPEPEGPTDEEVWKFWDEVDGSIPTIFRAALTRWGRPALKPVPMSERLPKAEDCDAQGNCWLTNSSTEPGWVLDNPEKCTNWTHWVPHWAMPVVTK